MSCKSHTGHPGRVASRRQGGRDSGSVGGSLVFARLTLLPPWALSWENSTAPALPRGLTDFHRSAPTQGFLHEECSSSSSWLVPFLSFAFRDPIAQSPTHSARFSLHL